MSILAFGTPSTRSDVFEDLLETHLDGLYSVALRYVKDPAMAKDLAHDTAVRALRFRESFAPGSNFKAWIYTIMTNTFINGYRRKQREREIFEGSSREDVLTQTQSDTSREHAQKPELALLEQSLSNDVTQALQGLSVDLRAVVMLCDLEGLSYRDVAQAVQCPMGTVMSRLFRARRALKRKLGAVAKEHGIVRDSVFPTVVGRVDTRMPATFAAAASVRRPRRRQSA